MEKFTVVVTGFLVASIDFSSQIITLSLPFRDDSIEVLATLLIDNSSSMSALVLQRNFLQVSLHPALALLAVSDLNIELVNGFLSFLNTSLKFATTGFKFINTAHSLSFVAGAPQLNFSLSLGEGLKSIRLAFMLILNPLLSGFEFGGKALELGKQRRTVTSFSISKTLHILQLGSEGNLLFVHGSKAGLTFLNLTFEVQFFNLKPLSLGLSFIQSTGKFIELGVGINNRTLEELTIL